MSSVEIFEQSLAYFLEPVGDLLADESVSEVMINGADQVFVERKGRLERVENRFPGERALLACARNIAQFSGKRIAKYEPRIDGRLPDGSRVHIIMPPVARNGITIAIRKFSESTLTLDMLEDFGSIDKAARQIMEALIGLHRNILVSGGTGSGKTSLLNALSAVIPNEDRILVLEDTSELRLHQEHVVSLESRKADRHGKGEVEIRDLLHSALRLRPDRIIVGECRGGEALDMIQAMNTGHSGSMTTVHANSPLDSLSRIETLALLSGVELPLTPLRAQVASALHAIVQTDRLQDGSRKTVFISEVLPLDAQGRYAVRDLLTFIQTGKDADGKVQGEHRLGSEPPTWWPEVEAKGLRDAVPALAAAWG